MPTKLPNPQIVYLLKYGQVRRGKLVGIHFKKGEDVLRWQVILGSGIGSAHQRIRLKRRSKALINIFLKTQEPRFGDYLFIVKKQAETASFQELKQDLERIF
ncbi:ribonuclease P protein component [Candidatus Beckwithbacteria bacterium]|nr:ribonuclease P protein component [Candidatus Beckwithbacteria bacterium]